MFNRIARGLAGALALACAIGVPAAAAANPPPTAPTVRQLASFAAAGCTGGCGSGSTIGPDHALYVTDGKAGRVLRVDPGSGAITTFASGLPPSIEAVGIGGAIDVAFVGRTAYVLETLVGPFFGQTGVVDGIYRVENGSAVPVADIGSWSSAHPPATDYFVPSGVQYALQPFRGAFVVTDGHHNRVLRVTADGAVSEMRAFGDIVPTGIDVRGDTVFIGEAGPVPHLPETGKVVAFTPRASAAEQIASGAPLIVDVEIGRGGRLYALSQGFWDWPNDPANAGKPAAPNTGTLVRAQKDGSLTPLVDGLDRPTSLELVGTTAYVVTLTGTVVRIDDVPK